MGNSKIDMNILAKRVELLEMRVKELTSVEPEALNERLSKIAHHEHGDSSLQATGQNHLFRQEGAFEMDAQQPYHPSTKGQCQ